MPRTNSLQDFINAFDEETIIQAVEAARARQQSRDKKIEEKISPVTNPIIRFIIRTAVIKNEKIHQRFDLKSLDANEFMYFTIASKLLHLLQAEISSNEYYKDELKKGLLGFEVGAALSDLNELVAAAYYKHCGKAISFAGADGMPDVDIKNTVFATDAKIFNNGSIQLRSTLNESRTIIPKVFAGQPAGNVVVSLFTPDKKRIHKSLLRLLKHIESGSDERFQDDDISIFSTRDPYEAGDVTFNSLPENFNVTFQASWDLADSIELLKKSVIKSIEQVDRLQKRCITWVFAPEDAGKYGIQSQALRFAGGFHPFVEDLDTLQAVVVYSLAPNKKGNQFGAATTVDVYGHSSIDLRIDKDTVSDFLLTPSRPSDDYYMNEPYFF